MKRSLQLLALIIVLCAGFAAKAEACECTKFPLPHDVAIKEAVEHNFGTRAGLKLNMDEDVTIVKAYPTLVEKLDLFGWQGTSCESTGPQGEFLYHCTNRAKADYVVKLQDGKCQAVIQIKSTYRKVVSKVKSTDC